MSDDESEGQSIEAFVDGEFGDPVPLQWERQRARSSSTDSSGTVYPQRPEVQALDNRNESESSDDVAEEDLMVAELRLEAPESFDADTQAFLDWFEAEELKAYAATPLLRSSWIDQSLVRRLGHLDTALVVNDSSPAVFLAATADEASALPSGTVSGAGSVSAAALGSSEGISDVTHGGADGLGPQDEQEMRSIISSRSMAGAAGLALRRSRSSSSSESPFAA